MELKRGLFIRSWSTGHNTLLETAVSMTSWPARGHGDAPAKHSHLVPGHRPSPWWEQCTWLSGPACWGPLGKVNRLGSPWKILRQWMSAEVHGVKRQVSEAVFILAMVIMLKITLWPWYCQWLWNVPDLPFPQIKQGHMHRTEWGMLPFCLCCLWKPWAKGLSHT